jgi:UDP-N-acetylmuramoyl-L-alanyl-D-glutamate--2,6-diaminopimelate ligase
MIRRLKNFYHLLVALLANIVYRFPSKNLVVIGVTGTDGKTTTVHLICHILKEVGLKSDLISSVSAPGLHVTTPDPWILQQMLRKMVNKGIKYVILEVTSHGLDQHRLAGIKFWVGVVTNVTHEHLDYHRTYKNYLAVKAKLFRGVKIAVLNRDDKSYEYLSVKCKVQSAKCVTYGIKNGADFTPKTFKFKTLLPGDYNQYNCLTAIAAASSLGIPEDKIKKAVASFEGVEGRMEEIDEGQDFKVIVDFAHTPNALENVLRTLKSLITNHQSLIAVFGCAGLRDVQKRPIMGEIAAQYTDFIVLTAEDPRTEDVNEIIDQIANGCKKADGMEGKTFFRIPDRAEAIRFAIQKLAKKGDIVIICGKGHEKSMCFGKTEYPCSDQKEAKKALKDLKKNA